MREVSYCVACSLDGFIATIDDRFDWLFSDDDYGFDEYYRSVDCIVMGRRTFDVAINAEEYPYSKKKAYVFTRRATESPIPEAQFVNEDPARFVKRLKSEAGGRIWVAGGGIIATALMQVGLVDELVLTIHPITLGQGVPLFTPHGTRSGWKLHSSKSWHNGMLQTTYRRSE
jgi:dihydrofolate reductase